MSENEKCARCQDRCQAILHPAKVLQQQIVFKTSTIILACLKTTVSITSRLFFLQTKNNDFN